MRIAIVGSGRIGSGLGRAWVRAGHVVVFGVRQPDDPKHVPLVAETGATVTTLAAALDGADVTVLATPFAAVADVARELPDWSGRVVVDCTNAIGPGPGLTVGHTDSAAEVNARLLPGAALVKSFTAQGAESLANPVYGGVRATNFYCGDDPEAKRVVRGLIEDVGFEPMDLGGLSAARVLEPMTLVWLFASRVLGSREFAFTLLRR